MRNQKLIEQLRKRWGRLEAADLEDLDRDPERLRELLARRYEIDDQEAERQISEFKSDATLLWPPG